MGNRHLLHVRSNQVTNNEPKLPQSSDIRYGELAINYAKGNETISLKNSNDEIVSFNIGKSIKGVKVNNVNATIANNIASVTISGSDENVGTYTSVQYPNEFSGATPVSGTQTIAQAFNSVETTVSALTQELIKDELAIEKINKSIVESAGIIDENNEIRYNVNENAHYISAATSLANADDILDAKVAEIDSAMDDMLYAGAESVKGGAAAKASSMPTGVIDSTSTAAEYTATVDDITELRPGVFCYLMNVNSPTPTTATTLNINGLGAKPLYASMSAGTHSTIFSSGRTMMFVYNTTRVATGCWDVYYGYQYDSNTDTIGYQIRRSAGAFLAKGTVYRNKILFQCSEKEVIPASTANITSTGSTADRGINTESFNPFGAILCWLSSTTINSGSTIGAAAAWDQNAVDLRYSFNMSSALISNQDVFVKCQPIIENGKYTGKVTLASNPLTQTLPSTEDGLLYLQLGRASGSSYSIILQIHHPIYYYKDGGLRLWANQTETDISGKADINHTHVSSAVTIEEDYQEISYPQSFSGATNVESGQTVTEAFQNVETTISALTQEMLNNELVTEKAIKALGNAAGTIDENDEIAYIINDDAHYINAATSLADADNLLDAALYSIASSSQNSISGVNVNGVDATITNKVANVGISGNNINVGTYTSIEYPSDLSGATPISGIQTINQAFNSVETTISALTQEVLNDELVTEKAIKDVSESAGLVDSNNKITYIKNPNATYIRNANSLADADNKLDTAIASKGEKISVVNHGTSDTTFALTPNTLHIWGAVTTLNLSLATPTDNTILNEYMFQFESSSVATNLILPNTIEWIIIPSIEANKTYQVSIVNNLGVIGGA